MTMHGSGPGMRCKGWRQEAALRMLENNLHPDVAERPEDLVVYGGIGKAARNEQALAAIKRELTTLEDHETLLVQSGKPVGVFETHTDAPRVLIANSNLVPQWATWDKFRELDAAGLMMYGQMTAGSWIYIGTQGILQGTYETFAALARQRFDGSLRGKLVVTAGLGGMGGAQPLAVTMNEGCALAWRSICSGSSAGSSTATSTSGPARSTTRSPGSRRPRTTAGRSRSACSATPPRSCRSSCAAARRSTS